MSAAQPRTPEQWPCCKAQQAVAADHQSAASSSSKPLPGTKGHQQQKQQFGDSSAAPATCTALGSRGRSGLFHGGDLASGAAGSIVTTASGATQGVQVAVQAIARSPASRQLSQVDPPSPAALLARYRSPVLKKTVTVKLQHPADAGWSVAESPQVLIDCRSFSCRTHSCCTLLLHIAPAHCSCTFSPCRGP
jgi:hypothetical protein